MNQASSPEESISSHQSSQLADERFVGIAPERKEEATLSRDEGNSKPQNIDLNRSRASIRKTSMAEMTATPKSTERRCSTGGDVLLTSLSVHKSWKGE